MGADAFDRKVDVVKDIKDVQWITKNELSKISNEVSKDKLDNFDFKKFDEQIEQSFQTFLTSIDNHKGSESIKGKFNEWLDKQENILDGMRDAEIAKKIIKPITFELNREATIVGLEDIQRSLGTDKLKNLKLFSNNDIDTNHLAQLFNLKFDGRDHLLELLNGAKKENGNENVKKFQRIIAWLDEEWRDDTDKNKTAKLWDKWVDWNFWIDTMKAFEKYIADRLEKTKVSLNANITSLTDNDLNNLKDYVEQNKNQQTLDLKQIQTITPNIAKELANFNWEIDLSGLNSLNAGILTIFYNNKSTVKFPNWKLEGEKITIGNNDVELNQNNIWDICKKLVNSTENQNNTNNSNNNSGNSNQSQENDSSNSSNDTTNSVSTQNSWNIQALHEWFNYAKAENEVNEKELPKNEKDAIKLLTVWTKAYWVARIFRAKWFNTSSSIVDKDYDPMRNKPERIRLKALRSWLEACVDKDWKLDVQQLKEALAKGGKGDLAELSTLYKDFKSDKFGNFPYLERVMELIDDCFIQWKMVDSSGNEIDTFEELYKDILIGNNYDILAHKEKEISDLAEIKEELNKLEQDIIGDNNLDKLTSEYKQMILAMENIGRLLNTNSEWFKAVMDKFSFAEGNEKKSVFKNIDQVKFACCLCDLNTDWKVDVADKDTKTWQELFNLIIDSQIEGRDAMNNILDYALVYADNCGHNNTKKLLEDMKTKDDALKVKHIADHPILMQYLREMLTKASIDNVRAIIMNWKIDSIEQTKEEKKFWEYMMNPEVGKTVNERFSEALAQIKKDLDANKELSKDQKEEILKNLKNNPENIKRMLRTAFSWYLALSDSWSIWAWATIVNFWDLFNNALASNFALWAHWWVNWNGALFWLSLAGGASWGTDRLQFTLWWAAGWSYNFWEWGWRGLSAILAPWILWEINGKYLENTLDVSPASYLWLNAIWLWTLNPANREWGLGVGGAISARNDMLVGIDQTSKNMSMKVLDSLINAYNTWKWKWNFLDEAKFNELVKEQLKTIFPETQEKTYDKTLKILYTWLLYYLQKNNGEWDNAPSDAEMWKIFDNVSKDFALNWKNTAVASLNGDVDMTWLSMWAIYVWGTWIVPVVWIQITNYENLFAHDTQESKNRYESSLYSEFWMEFHGNSLDKNGYINADTVNYLNKKLSIFFPRWDVPDIVLSNNWNHVLRIPKALCNYIDVSYSSELKDFIKEVDDNNFEVPANMKIWLSTYIGWWTMRANLILWDNKKTESNVQLTADSKFSNDADPNKYVSDSERISLNDVNKINAGLKEFLVNNKDFPLGSCERANGEQILFNVLEWAKVSIDPNSTLLMKNWKILLPGNPSGELKVAKKTNGEYVVSFDSNNSKKLTIKYNKISNFTDKFDFQNKELDKLFDDIEKWLSTMDNWKKDYSAFMENALKLDYNQAFDKLTGMLKLDNNKIFSNLSNYLKSTNLTVYDKMLVVDRFKAIFSYNPNLTNPTAVENQLKNRKDQFTKLKWYTDDNFPLNNGENYREQVKDLLMKQNKIERKHNPNLIGMTAFYRKDNNKAQSYLLTELWGTNVLWGVTKEIDQSQLEATQNWLINNLEKNTLYEKELLRSIVNTLKINRDKFNIDNADNVTIHDKLSRLLKWEKDVDIWWKIVTIKSKYVFYLLWECANESIWVEIAGVESDSVADSVSIDYDVSGSSAWLYVRTQAAESQMGISANKHNLDISGVFSTEPEPVPPTGGWTWNIPPTGGWTWNVTPSGGWTWNIPKVSRDGVNSFTANTTNVK